MRVSRIVVTFETRKSVSWVKYDLVPQPKVRPSKVDTWRPRPFVLKWRAFADAARASGATLADGAHVRFEIAMPASWSAKKRLAMAGQPHRQKPDLDNLCGGLMDALMPASDSHIASLGGLSKVWAEAPAIWIGSVVGE
jgi:Holliday junction resolvase RusA-like endonuclease